MNGPLSQAARLESALAGKYRIERKLGEGGMATVYLAEDVKHERNVALKILRPELAAVIGAERFLAEIKTTANLQHPHILPLFDSGEADGFLYYVMPYIAGDNLRERIQKEGQLGVDEALKIARGVAEALDYAHRNEIIHRDIKPANILLHGSNPVVADFGIALAISAAGGGRMTETGLSLGTPHYMSPEQASADRDLSARSDIYSLGCVLYEMLAGQPPHTGPSAQTILVRILTEDPRPITDFRRSVPPHVAATVMKALERLPADRFDSAKDFMAALGDAGFTHSVMPRATTAGATAPVRSSSSWFADTRSKVMVGLVMVLGALAAFTSIADMADTPTDARVIQFDIVDPDPDPDDEFGVVSWWMAISPDGGHIALVESGEGGASRIAIRDMDGPGLRVLAEGVGTDFRSPMFSPDGELVAYVADEAVRVVSVDGGSPRTLVPSVEGGGPMLLQWTEEGTLLLTDTSGDIFYVPDGGADAATLLVDVDGQVGGAHLLPGGRYLLYASSRRADHSELRIADLEADSSWTLQGEAMEAKYLESGHVVYGHPGQSLVAFPFDASTGRATGRPFPIMEPVSVLPIGGNFDVSRNGTLVYNPGRVGSIFSRTRTLFEVDTTGSVTSVGLADSEYGQPMYSPDGTSIAFAEGGQIMIFNLRTGSKAQLTVTRENRNPIWAPDGSELVFASRTEDAEDADIYRIRVDGTSDAELVVSLPGEQTPYAWTEGDTIVFTSVLPRDIRGGDILLVHLAGDGEPTPFLNAPWREGMPALSPDGRWMAYQSTEGGDSELVVRSFPDATGRWVITEGGGHTPIWSPDGSGIWYRAFGSQDLVFLEVSTDPSFSVGERRVVLGEEVFQGGRGRIHPDGERFIVAGVEGAVMGFNKARPRVIVNWFEELRASGVLGGGKE